MPNFPCNPAGEPCLQDPSLFVTNFTAPWREAILDPPALGGRKYWEKQEISENKGNTRIYKISNYGPLVGPVEGDMFKVD